MLQNYSVDEVIVWQGDTERCLYKIMSGSVALYLNYGTDNEYLIGMLSFPECFGEMTVLSARPCPYTVVAFKDVQILRVAQENFNNFIESDYKNALVIMRTMAKNIAMTNMNMSMLLDEIKAVSEGGESDELTALAGRYAGSSSESDALCSDGSSEQAQNAHPLDRLYLEGHGDYSGIVHPEYRRYVFEEQYTCPCCEKVFKSYRIMPSKLLLGCDLSEQRYDLRKTFEDFEPSWYELVTCPECYFTTFSGQFLSGKSISRFTFDRELEDARQIVRLDFDGERDLELVFAQHYLALLCASGSDSFRQLMARLWTNLYWLYEDADEPELARQALAKAIDAYEHVLKRCALIERHRRSSIMTLAGLYFAYGNYNQAKENASQLFATKYRELATRLIKQIKSLKEDGDAL